jgi:hypothetical protein
VPRGRRGKWVTEPEELIEEFEMRFEREKLRVEDAENVNYYPNFCTPSHDIRKCLVLWYSYVVAYGRYLDLPELVVEYPGYWRAWAVACIVGERDAAREWLEMWRWNVLKGIWVDALHLRPPAALRRFLDDAAARLSDDCWHDLRRAAEMYVSYPPEDFAAMAVRVVELYRELAARRPGLEEFNRAAARLIREMAPRLCRPARPGYGAGTPPRFTPRTLVFNVMALERAARETLETELEEFLAELRRALDRLTHPRRVPRPKERWEAYCEGRMSLEQALLL